MELGPPPVAAVYDRRYSWGTGFAAGGGIGAEGLTTTGAGAGARRYPASRARLPAQDDPSESVRQARAVRASAAAQIL